MINLRQYTHKYTMFTLGDPELHTVCTVDSQLALHAVQVLSFPTAATNENGTAQQ